MTQLNKFEDLNGWFLSLETGMTQPNKFENLNNRFASLETGMTQPNKFKDRWWTLLYRNGRFQEIAYQNDSTSLLFYWFVWSRQFSCLTDQYAFKDSGTMRCRWARRMYKLVLYPWKSPSLWQHICNQHFLPRSVLRHWEKKYCFSIVFPCR